MRQSLLAAVACVLAVGVATAQAPVPTPLAHPTAADLAHGSKLFAGYCSRCHGADGTGGMGPSLARPRLRRAADEAGIIDILQNGVPGTNMAAAFWLSGREIAQVAAYVRSLGQRPEEVLPGDPARGRDVYGRSGCATCHIVKGDGAGIGPDLSDIGAQRGASFLRQSLIDPGAARPERPIPYEPYTAQAYLMVRVLPRGGTEITGIRVNEDAFTIQIRDQQGLHSFRKRELARLVPEPGLSLMPSYRDSLKAREVDDLVAFLMTLRMTR
jgi:putative heme-binding domain-containing protein